MNLDPQNHWLTPLFAPCSVALVGASLRPGSIGNNMYKLLSDGGYQGTIYPINPRHHSLFGQRCFESIAALPKTPDCVVFAISGAALEQAFDEAIAKEVGAMVIFANTCLAADTQPPLPQRLRDKARAAGIPVCGGNGMGFYNYDAQVMISFDRPPIRPSGSISLIAHSGSALTYLVNNDARYTYNLAVSPGQEINATVADYMDYALEQPTTRVLALFMEAVRDAQGFIAALQKAYERDIPVVIVKLGRTEKSAGFAASHSGAIAGSDEAFQAVCDHYGVIRVRDMDELAATALLLSQSRRPRQGSVASLLDSGGLREQFIDLAEELGVPFAQISARTRQRLSANLEFGFEPDNPVDAMGALNADVKNTVGACLRALLDDPDTALLTFEFEFRDNFCHYPMLFDVAKEVLTYSEKLFLLVNSSSSVRNAETAAELSHAGIPVINGADIALRAIRNVLRYRDRRPTTNPTIILDSARLSHWCDRFKQVSSLDESTALRLLSDFELPTVPFTVAETLDTTLAAAETLGYPVVMKTAEPGIQHKSDVQGVKLSLADAASVQVAYCDLARRLGSRVLVAPMVETGIELAFGMVNDAQFGPVIMLSAGGIHVEILDDRYFALAAFDEVQALRLINQLKIHKLLQGVRGKPPCRIDLAAAALSRFSVLMAALGDQITEMDLNPVIVSPKGCTIVDALVILSVGE